ncbi:MAG: Uma2 family endonuclease [Polyangiaceae bacterium]|nr:Uma2 family endonuclease [Polyangiaceae bacterium]
MSAVLKVSRATLVDLLAIPEGERRHELIDGEIIPKEVASPKHGAVQSSLSEVVGPFRRRSGGRPGGWWFATEVEIWFDEANTLRPDIAGWRRERVAEPPDETPVRVRPDWICEILSTNRSNDLVRKKRVYHRAGVPHYWIIDPIEKTLSVLRWASEGYLEVLAAERHDTVRPEPFEALPLQVGILFDDDPAE